MNNLQLTYTPYSAKLKKPFQTSGTTITVRRGFILILKSENKSIGIGEAVPLPEFGSETYEETEKALANLNLKLSLDLNNIELSIEENLNEFNNLPSLKCGLELAILKLISNEKKIPISKLLKRKQADKIFVNGVIGLEHVDKAAGSAKELLDKGFKTLKLKTGRDNFEDDFNVISEIRKIAGSEIKIRIDSNGKWNVDEAADYLNRLEQFDIEYAEQPVKDLNDFSVLKEKTKVPLAADESIRKPEDAESAIFNKSVSYLILKPMMTGGIIPVLNIADLAKKNGIESIVTSSFEGAIGRIGAVYSAALINNDFAHGLATGDFFDEENVPDPFPVSDGKIEFKE